MTAEFVHLHVHSEYSLLDGLPHPAELAQRAKDLNQRALAITDHGSMFAAIEFHDACRQNDVKPIIGLESYLAPRGRKDRDPKLDRNAYHLVLLAENETGYRNLMRLASRAQLEGFYYYPRVDKEILAQHSEGIIATTGCLAAEVPQLILSGRHGAVREAISWYREVFRDRFYVELQNHGIPELEQVNQELVALADKFGLKKVATNDVHYLNADDWFAQDILICIQTATTVTATDRMKMAGRDYYFKSTEEMAALWAHYPDALSNTLEIAERCTLDLTSHGYRLPYFPIPEGFISAEQYLRWLCEAGLKDRYHDQTTSEIRQRFEYELGVIHQMGFDTYFLIVWDLCRYARERGIWYNVRGSAASSIVAYCLGITNLDPLEHRLVFERFLNPGRISMPDIDLDFPDDAREEMIGYTVGKYGKENVAQIITFGKLLAKAAIRDVGRALDYPLTEVDRVAKLIPAGPGQTIEGALERIPEFRELCDSSDYIKKLVENSKLLEGVARHASTHAAGVVVADKPIVEYTPLHRATRGNDAGFPVTQYPMGALEHIGLLKIDFLGLATLTIMRRACELIERRHGVHYDLANIPVEDKGAFGLMSRGDVIGLFQVEGGGMRRVLTQMKPHKFDHIVAAISLYRPGPMDYIPKYIARMHGEEQITYDHPALEHILDETFGVVVYQEQILRIAMDLCGYTASEADLLRKAVGKKQKEELLAQREKFVKGAMEHGGVPGTVANKLFDDLEFFARYGFNKAHGADYAVLTCQTAFLKAHYPLEFTCALLQNEIGNLEKIAVLVAEARRMGIPILEPDVRYSGVGFVIDEEHKGIRFALSAIKNVGAGVVEVIVDARKKGAPFASLDDFCRRVDLRQVNRRVLESLIKAGALSGFGHREQLLKVLDRMMSVSASAHEASALGQLSFFGTSLQADTFTHLPRVPDMDNREKLELEKELMGVYFSEHPLDKLAQSGKQVVTAYVGELGEEMERQEVTLGGMIGGVRVITTKKGAPMAFFQLEDPQGSIEVTAFPRVYADARELMRDEALVLVKGKVQVRESKVTILAASIKKFPLQPEETNGNAKDLNGNAQPAKETTQEDVTDTAADKATWTDGVAGTGEMEAQGDSKDYEAPTAATVSVVAAATAAAAPFAAMDDMPAFDDWVPPPEEFEFEERRDLGIASTAHVSDERSFAALATPVPPLAGSRDQVGGAAQVPSPLATLNLSEGINVPSKGNRGNGGNVGVPHEAAPARENGGDQPQVMHESVSTYMGRVAGRVVRIHIQRSQDANEDIRRMRELLKIFRSVEGQDRFSMIVPNGDAHVLLDFPNFSTNYDLVANQLRDVMSDWGRLEVQ
jgi:DNA polymerase III subunit alpha